MILAYTAVRDFLNKIYPSYNYRRNKTEKKTVPDDFLNGVKPLYKNLFQTSE